MTQFHIYTLSDPRDNSVRYVGCTINPKIRFDLHLKEGSSVQKDQWVKELNSLSLQPLMNVVSIKHSVEDAKVEEQRVYSTFDSTQLLCYNPNIFSYKYTEPKENAKKKTSFTISENAEQLLKNLSEKLGVSQSAVIELSVREKAEKEGVK